MLNYSLIGTLEPGIYMLTIEEIIIEYGYTDHRIRLLNGMQRAILALRSCGCTKIFLDGSFVTRKRDPNDYDACWDHEGVDLMRLKILYPEFFEFSNSRQLQKSIYEGEWFPAYLSATEHPIIEYINFFQLDKENNSKGIVQLKM